MAAAAADLLQLIISVLFVLNIRVRKPGNVGTVVMTVLGLAVLAGVLIIC